MTTLSLNANKREVFGKKLSSIRKNGLVPANIYGKHIEPIALELKLSEFLPVYKEAGETGLLKITVGGESLSAMIGDVSINPVSGDIVHVDFRHVSLKEKIKASVPVEAEGESPAEKEGLGTMIVQIDEIEVEALPTDFPEKITFDATKLVSLESIIGPDDLIYDKAKLTLDLEESTIIAKIEELQKEEEPIVSESASVEAGGEASSEPAVEQESEEKTETSAE